jgi:hypothetical protein
MDGVGEDLPYANLTVSLITDGVSIEVTDWATPYVSPEDYQDRIVGVGLYASDFLCDRYIPVGMGSARELTDTFESLTEAVNRATRTLYSHFAAMSFEQMVEAGLQTYLRAPVDFAQMTGTYRQGEWDGMDERTRRLFEIYNEEYALDAYVDYFGAMVGLTGSSSEYYLHPVSYASWRRGGGTGPLPTPGRNANLVPAGVLVDHEYPRRANPGGLAGITTSSTLPAKTGRYTTTQGRLTEEELNAAARDFRSPLFEAPWRHFDEQWVKWHWREPEVDAAYRYGQERSRLLRDGGAALRREDLDRIRREAGERPWGEVSAEAAVEEVSS